MTRSTSIFGKTGLLACTALIALGLSACNTADRLASIGATPELSGIDNPTHAKGYTPVSMPMPATRPQIRQANSLWTVGSRAFFKDQRASQVGDIITVIIQIADDAQLENTTRRTRANTEDAGLTGLFGLEAELGKVLPDAVNPGNLLGLESGSSSTGAGTINRSEDINLRVAAVIVQKLPNGNMVLRGRQEVRVNYEVRELVVGGVIRPEDISSTNTIAYDRLAEARIAYGGRGHITDVQQPRYGQQVFDIIMPF
ncbi:flagellar basal body L-ring protein FlgH [Oceanibaculum pacificum]|uniref:Flagellar L-ring protein n=1 Tax=Oceanibaculum pacificum TaxID=580166 RepID=A0A154W3U2_9PROT|nr:flagellar basal body L-ring protein FlgH [Oceanibaculum pacificum]KZD08133.1 flagellar biosynthesis protein FlgH [Oceanibaculum pacificum]